MAEVYRRDFYEYPFDKEGEEIQCEDCGEGMEIPSMDDVNRDMKEPFWLRFNNVFKSFCEPCWCDRVFEEDLSEKGGAE